MNTKLTVYYGPLSGSGITASYEVLTDSITFDTVKELMDKTIARYKGLPKDYRILQVTDSGNLLYYHYLYGFVNPLNLWF